MADSNITAPVLDVHNKYDDDRNIGPKIYFNKDFCLY